MKIKKKVILKENWVFILLLMVQQNQNQTKKKKMENWKKNRDHLKIRKKIS